MCGGFTCSKNTLIALNILYILVSCILISVAVYGSRIVSIVTNLPIIGGILACGVLLILISILGLAGAVKHHQIMLFFYMVILFLLFLIQFSIACASLAVNSEQQESLAMEGWKQLDMDTKGTVQSAFECCSFNDRSITNGTMGHPTCIAVDAQCCSASQTDQDCGCPSCMSKLQAAMNYAFKLCGGIGLFFSFTELLAVFLARRYRNQVDPDYIEPHAIFPEYNYTY